MNMTLCCGGYVATIVEVERGRVLTQLDQYRERLEAPANDCLRARRYLGADCYDLAAGLGLLLLAGGEGVIAQGHGLYAHKRDPPQPATRIWGLPSQA